MRNGWASGGALRPTTLKSVELHDAIVQHGVHQHRHLIQGVGAQVYGNHRHTEVMPSSQAIDRTDERGRVLNRSLSPKRTTACIRRNWGMSRATTVLCRLTARDRYWLDTGSDPI